MTAWVNGQSITGSMSNYGGKEVSANKVAKDGENALITIPNTGYYNTESKLQVPISTLQDTIGGINFDIADFQNMTAKTALIGLGSPLNITFDDNQPHTVMVVGSYYNSTDKAPHPAITLDKGTILKQKLFANDSVRGFAVLFTIPANTTSVNLTVPLCSLSGSNQAVLNSCLNGTKDPIPASDGTSKRNFNIFILVS